MVLLPGFCDDSEARRVSSSADVDAAEDICLTERLLAAAPSNLTLAGGAAMFLGSNLDLLPVGFPSEVVDGRYLLGWEDIPKEEEQSLRGEERA